MHFKAGSNTPMLPLEAGDFQLDEHCNLSAVRDLSNHAEMESAFSYFLNKQHVEIVAYSHVWLLHQDTPGGEH